MNHSVTRDGAPKRAVRTDEAPTPTGPFNQAVRCGSFVFTGGQAGRDRETGQMGDTSEQANWALRNIERILDAAGASLAQVVKVTVYLREDADAKGFNQEYAGHFPEPLPARSLVYVSKLKNPDMLVEIEAIAVVH